MPSNKRLGRLTQSAAQPITLENDEQNVKLSSESAQINDESAQASATIQVPAELPILPLRGLVVYPQTAMPLNIGQRRSVLSLIHI
jgi:ATP-dependent Lon protease